MVDPIVRKYYAKYNIYPMSGEMFTKEHHEDNNSIIFHFDEIKCGYWRGTKCIGYTDRPAFREGNGYGVMFENSEGDRFWCHIGEESFEMRPGLDKEELI